jgi:excisionase family DNA binding protein
MSSRSSTVRPGRPSSRIATADSWSTGGQWQHGGVNTSRPETSEASTETPAYEGTETDLPDLVGEWLDWSQAAELLHVSVSKVRQLIREHSLAAVVPVAGEGQKVPAAFLQDGEIVKGLPGVLTVLHDGNYDDRAALTWLFTADDSLPGRPIDALRENRGREVKRRAQAMAF